MKKSMICTMAVLVGLAAAMNAPRATGVTPKDTDRKIGTLTCVLEGETDLMVYARRAYDCEFVRRGAPLERYRAVERRYGVTLGARPGRLLAWSVEADAPRAPDGALAGGFDGPSVEEALFGPTGARRLVGGQGDGFALEPLASPGRDGGSASITRFSLAPAG